jgi:hypothetical protein
LTNNQNKAAVEIARYFFTVTNKRATKATMSMSIGQAKSLLNAGFTFEEITKVIDYLTLHPPRNGFNSLGFLSYVMEEVLDKIKAKEVKELLKKQAPTTTQTTPVVHKSTHKVNSIDKRMGDEFNTNIF